VLIKLEFSQHIFETHSNIKFNDNLSSESRDFPCGQTYRQTDKTKLIVVFRNFAKALKMIVLGLLL